MDKDGKGDELCTIATKRWSENMAKLIENSKSLDDIMGRFYRQYKVMKEALDYTKDSKKIFSLEQIVDLIHPYTSREELPFSPPTRAAGKGEIGPNTGVIHITPEGHLNFSYRKGLKLWNFDQNKYYERGFGHFFQKEWDKKGKILMNFDSKFEFKENLDIFTIFEIAKIEKITTFFTTEKKRRMVYFSKIDEKIVWGKYRLDWDEYEIQQFGNAINLI
jgi:hypothetical protein